MANRCARNERFVGSCGSWVFMPTFRLCPVIWETFSLNWMSWSWPTTTSHVVLILSTDAAGVCVCVSYLYLFLCFWFFVDIQISLCFLFVCVGVNCIAQLPPTPSPASPGSGWPLCNHTSAFFLFPCQMATKKYNNMLFINSCMYIYIAVNSSFLLVPGISSPILLFI